LEQIGKYRILEKIGQGASGSVYKGYDAALGRHVAVKIISDVGADETGRRRFQREAQSAARLAHPHIITVYDFGQEQDKLYMAMELLEGTDLKQAIAERRLRTLDEKLDVMEQVCDGLAFAHTHAIVHRDLKPANIHLLPDGQVKVMDFGLARLSGSDMTRTGLVMGTPHYMSPEQVRGEHVDARSDVFSLGCVLYELLTGRKPFDAESMHSVLYMVLQARPRPPRELVPDLPPVVEQLLDRSLAREPAARFPDASEFLKAVQLVREVIAAGRGDETIPELEVPATDGAGAPAVPSRRPSDAPPAPGPAASWSASGSRSASGGGSRSGWPPTSVPPKPARPGALAFVIGGILLAATSAGTVLLTRRGPAAPTPTTSSAADRQLDKLARAVVETQVELARRRLEAGDYEDAARQAQKALRLDAEDPGAKKVLAEARKARDAIDQAAGDARTAVDNADTARAYWKLLELAPDHPAAGELTGRLDAVFRTRAEEAQRQASRARQAADKAQASRVDSFQEGASLFQDGEAAFRGKRYAAAAREFMRARVRFERAQRTGR